MSSRGNLEETERKTLEKPCGAIRTEPRHLNNQESLAQATGRCAVKNIVFCDVGDDMGKLLHDINERIKFGNIKSAAGICRYLEEGLGSVVIEGSIKCETAHRGVECMDKSEVRLRRPLYGIITPLLSHNGSLYHISLALGTHILRLCSSMDPIIHASKQSGLGQLWLELQHFLH